MLTRFDTSCHGLARVTQITIELPYRVYRMSVGYIWLAIGYIVHILPRHVSSESLEKLTAHLPAGFKSQLKLYRG